MYNSQIAYNSRHVWALNTSVYCKHQSGLIAVLFCSNYRGDTPLMLAKRRGDHLVIESLTEFEDYYIHNSLNNNNNNINWLIWYIKNTVRQLGCTLTILIILLCVIISWSFSVYYHKGHPFQ